MNHTPQSVVLALFLVLVVAIVIHGLRKLINM